MLQIIEFSKSYAANGACSSVAVENVTFTLERGDLMALVGPSGCGKSTLLSAVAGLSAPTCGRILLEGRPVTRPPKEMVLVFQDYANSLFPWRTVLGNVLFALEDKGMSKADMRAAALESLESVGLAGFAGHYPWQLSGGMQQRAAIARGLAYGSEILLMDEPFASVDAQTREDLEDLLLRVRDRYGKTVLLVTHDIDEAVYLANRVVALSRRPSTVAAEFEVDLPWPREQVTTRSLPRFIELRNQIHQLLKANAPSL